MILLDDLQEHQKIDNLKEYLTNKSIDNVEVIKEKLINNEEKLKNHYDIIINNNRLEVGYYVGLCVIDDIAIKISPKFNDDNIKIDIMQMMHECLNHNIVSKHLLECYKIYYHEPPVKIDNNICSDLYLFVIHRYITVLKDTIKHGLYKSFYKEQNILKGKIKGKLLINDTINIHLKENIKLNNKCIYEIHDVNNIENQILKYALQKAEIFSLESKNQGLYKNLCVLKEKFNNVENKIIKEIDFKKINKKIIHKGYKESLQLAYEVIKILDKNIYNNEQESNIYPFYINLPELFERYCEVKLWKNIPSLLVGYTKGNIDSQTATKAQRPDFIIPKNRLETKPYILDSKYSIKYADIEKQNDTDELINDKIGKIKDHLQQISLYARTKKIQAYAKAYNSSEINLCILYPVANDAYTEYNFKNMIDEAGIENKYLSKNIEQLYYIPIKLPVLKKI